MMVFAKDRMWHFAVRNYLYRTVVIFKLLFGYDIRVVAMDRAIDTNDALDNAGYCADVVRDHNDSHLLVQGAQ